MHYIVIQSAYINVYINICMCVLYVYKDAYTFIYEYDYMQFLTKPKQLEVLDLACASVQVWRSEVWMGDVVGDVGTWDYDR